MVSEIFRTLFTSRKNGISLANLECYVRPEKRDFSKIKGR